MILSKKILSIIILILLFSIGGLSYLVVETINNDNQGSSSSSVTLLDENKIDEIADEDAPLAASVKFSDDLPKHEPCKDHLGFTFEPTDGVYYYQDLQMKQILDPITDNFGLTTDNIDNEINETYGLEEKKAILSFNCFDPSITGYGQQWKFYQDDSYEINVNDIFFLDQGFKETIVEARQKDYYLGYYYLLDDRGVQYQYWYVGEDYLEEVIQPLIMLLDYK